MDVSIEEIKTVLDECFICELTGNLEIVTDDLKRVELSIQEVKKYCNQLIPYVEQIKSMSNRDLDKADLLTFALQIFFETLWTHKYLTWNRYEIIYEIKLQVGLIKEPYVKAKHRISKTWWLRNKCEMINKSIESLKMKDQKKIRMKLNLPDDNFNANSIITDKGLDYKSSTVDRDTFYALTDGQLGPYEEFDGSIDDINHWLGK
jgi:hypothetical protein